jgi:uncharacterized protein (DUF1800 family)
MPGSHTAFLAVHRFGLGARPGDLDEPALRADPRGWLKAQLTTPPLPRSLSGQPSTADALQAHRDSRDSGRDAMKDERKMARQQYAEDAGRRIQAAVQSTDPFYERLVRFFGDVLTVSVQQNKCHRLVGPLDREVLRPLVLGRYEDLLLETTRHPAMLLYLDNTRSTGPDSPRGKRAERGRNENLAREILELHTVGVAAGYTQQDVIALADLLTGWSIDLGQGGQQHGERGFAFVTQRHQPGSKLLMGRRYPEGLSGGEQALRELARHPSTADHIARRMARHFVCDEPPPVLVQALSSAWRSSGGDIRQVATALVDCDAAWSAPLQKVRRPAELLIAALRALEIDLRAADRRAHLVRLLQQLNQAPWSAPSPEGWADTEAAWLDGDALLRRLDLISSVVRHRQLDMDADALAHQLFGAALEPSLQRILRDAPDPETGITLVLASPLFQRR